MCKINHEIVGMSSYTIERRRSRSTISSVSDDDDDSLERMESGTPDSNEDDTSQSDASGPITASARIKSRAKSPDESDELFALVRADFSREWSKRCREQQQERSKLFKE